MKNETEISNNPLKISRFSFFFRKNEKVALYHSLNMNIIYGNTNLVRLLKCFSKASTINKVLEDFPEEQSANLLSIIKVLENQGFLINCKMDENSMYENFRKKLPRPSIVTLRILVTTKCNFLCKYCQIERNLDASNKELSMSIPVAQQAIQLFSSLCPSEGLKTIILTGGEPSLNVPLLKYVIMHRNLIPGQTRIVLFTNGSPVSREFAKFLANQDVNVIVSIDGPKKIHNKMRCLPSGKSTFETAIEQYRLYKRMGCKVGISTVIGPQSFSIPNNKFANFFIYLHPESIGCNFPHYLIKSNHIPQINMKKYVEHLIYLYKIFRNEAIFIEQISRILVPLITKKPRLRECIAQGQGITIDPRGFVGNCKSFLISNTSNSKKIEDIEILRENNLLYKWALRSPFFMSNCQHCYAISVCGGGCTYDSWCLYKDVWQVDPRTCIFSKHLLKAIIWDIYEHACSDVFDDFFMFKTVDKNKIIDSYKEYSRDCNDLRKSAGH